MPRRDSSSSSVSRDSLRPSRRDKDFSKPASKRSMMILMMRQCPSQPSSSQQPDGSPHRSTVNVSAPDHKLPASPRSCPDTVLSYSDGPRPETGNTKTFIFVFLGLTMFQKKGRSIMGGLVPPPALTMDRA